ncbi:MAG TPA: hypothetical protein VFS72_01570 [Agromyces sp.]|nr:hypothetical protein [Agromyces sp.]
MIEQLALSQTASPAASSPDVWALLVPAVIAAVFGVVTGWVGAYLKVKAENYATKEEFDAALHRLAENTRTVGEENARIARRAALDSELREAVRMFAVAAGSVIHSMCWLTWDCVERKRISAPMVTSYDQEAHRLFPTMVSQLAVIAMLDRRVHDQLSPFADEIFSVDVQLSSAIVAEEQRPGTQGDALKSSYAASTDLEDRFRRGVANLFPDAGTRD